MMTTSPPSHHKNISIPQMSIRYLTKLLCLIPSLMAIPFLISPRPSYCALPLKQIEISNVRSVARVSLGLTIFFVTRQLELAGSDLSLKRV
uniref:Uncharacterized protein n=1 Tax=Pyxicephalus adspersus TaxID=30357 RepID=A0AAV3A0D0_PYXAD|nr:TPA: hypothetical protein GDO54_004798 [Pyxicephalus adspersus]